MQCPSRRTCHSGSHPKFRHRPRRRRSLRRRLRGTRCSAVASRRQGRRHPCRLRRGHTLRRPACSAGRRNRSRHSRPLRHCRCRGRRSTSLQDLLQRHHQATSPRRHQNRRPSSHHRSHHRPSSHRPSHRRPSHRRPSSHHLSHHRRSNHQRHRLRPNHRRRHQPSRLQRHDLRPSRLRSNHQRRSHRQSNRRPSSHPQHHLPSHQPQRLPPLPFLQRGRRRARTRRRYTSAHRDSQAFRRTSLPEEW